MIFFCKLTWLTCVLCECVVFSSKILHGKHTPKKMSKTQISKTLFLTFLRHDYFFLIFKNIQKGVNFPISCLKNGWKNCYVKKAFLASTQSIFFFFSLLTNGMQFHWGMMLSPCVYLCVHPKQHSNKTKLKMLFWNIFQCFLILYVSGLEH